MVGPDTQCHPVRAVRGTGGPTHSDPCLLRLRKDTLDRRGGSGEGPSHCAFLQCHLPPPRRPPSPWGFRLRVTPLTPPRHEYSGHPPSLIWVGSNVNEGGLGSRLSKQSSRRGPDHCRPVKRGLGPDGVECVDGTQVPPRLSRRLHGVLQCPQPLSRVVRLRPSRHPQPVVGEHSRETTRLARGVDARSCLYPRIPQITPRPGISVDVGRVPVFGGGDVGEGSRKVLTGPVAQRVVPVLLPFFASGSSTDDTDGSPPRRTQERDGE